MPKRVTVFRTPTWLRASVGVAFILTAGGFLLVTARYGLTYGTAGVGLVALFLAAGFADALTTRIELGSDALLMVTNFRKRLVPRDDIAFVTWEGGSGVALKLRSGDQIKLPDVGNSQSRTNSIRSWTTRKCG
jgi:hypothetical protein